MATHPVVLIRFARLALGLVVLGMLLFAGKLVFPAPDALKSTVAACPRPTSLAEMSGAVPVMEMSAVAQ